MVLICLNKQLSLSLSTTICVEEDDEPILFVQYLYFLNRMMFDRGRVSARKCNQHRFSRARERERLSYRIPLSPDSISHLFHPEPACQNSDCTLTTLGWEKQLIFMKYKMFNPDQSGKDTKCKSFLWQIKCSRQLEPRPLRWYIYNNPTQSLPGKSVSGRNHQTKKTRQQANSITKTYVRTLSKPIKNFPHFD